MAVDEIAVNVRVRKRVIGAQRLNLSDGGFVGAKVPKANIVKKSGILHGIDFFLPGSGERAFRGIAVQRECVDGRLNMALDVGSLNGDLVRPHVNSESATLGVEPFE